MSQAFEQSSEGPALSGGIARSDGRSKSVKRKINTKTLEDKYAAILEVEKGLKTKAQIARDLQINSSTLSTWLKNAESIKEGYLSFGPKRKLMKTSKWEEIDEALLKWFKHARDNGAIISGPLLIQKACSFAESLGITDFQGSTGWLDRFKERHNISFKSVCGESKSVNDSSDDMQQWKEKLKVVLDEYSPDNIYNADETGLFFRMLPDKTMEFRNVDCQGGKNSKERLTALICANMSGTDKLSLLVIGKSKKPRCFKNVRSLPTEYQANSKAWMTSEIFTKWVKELDRRFAKKGTKNVLIVDNCPAHPKVKGLTNTELIFLPPNTTSKTQPMDQGVIQNLKVFYRKRVVLRQIDAIDKKKDFKLTVLDALNMLQESWECVLPRTIANCYRKAGFVSDIGDVTEDDDDDAMDDIPLARLAILDRSANLPDFVNFTEDLPTCLSMSDEDIVSEIREKNTCVESDDEQDADDEYVIVPSHVQACEALDVLRRFIQSKEGVSEELGFVRKIDRFLARERLNIQCNAKQTSLNDFFEMKSDVAFSTRL